MVSDQKIEMDRSRDQIRAPLVVRVGRFCFPVSLRKAFPPDADPHKSVIDLRELNPLSKSQALHMCNLTPYSRGHLQIQILQQYVQ